MKTVSSISKLVGSIFFVVGLSMCIPAGILVVNTLNFLSSAEKVTGKVVALLHEGDSYRPLIEYKAKDGMTYEGEHSITSKPPLYQKGEAVGIYYNPNNPYDFVVDGFWGKWGVATLLGILGTIFFVIGLLCLIMSFIASGRRKLRETGVHMRADITDISVNEYIEVNGRHPWQIRAEGFNPVSGEMTEFVSFNLMFDPKKYVGRGDKIDVYIDKNNPKRYFVEDNFLKNVKSLSTKKDVA